MTLHDLKGIIDFTFDIADDEIDASFYIELDEINEEYIKQIEVVKIGRDYVICKLTNFIRRQANFFPTKFRKYFDDNYYAGEQKEYLIQQIIDKQHNGENITDDGGEAVYHFIENDLYDYLTQGEEK